MIRIRNQNTFEKVLNNCDDQIIVRELLRQYVPMECKAEIVRKFNEHADRINEIAKDAAYLKL